MKKFREMIKIVGLSALAIAIGIVEVYLIYSLIRYASSLNWLAKSGVLIVKIDPLMAMWGIFMLGLMIWFFIYNWRNPDAYEYFIKELVTATEGGKEEQTQN